ncbi:MULTISPECIES: AIM24 family protein [Streptomyces]|uniref:AIM24 family protein n=1 Tax=Streptomyces cacaoi TaxID=1898 RepID=A0A4Y3R7P7_STRCI|nr:MULTISPECIES: AIM24 family protein [Streptomyces]NNG89668.1 AIM24 family protein [Streptomyces cacaoi]QHF96809.1 AIM24 family protein [Streptomyces sp. NHF165]GEB53594.1 hypothetical protein SCA03_61450 [Streptomyces cacaoi]
MQSSLFGYAEVQTQDRWAVQNPQLLRVQLTGHDDVLARKGAMVAYQGLLEFDAEYESQGRRRRHGQEHLDLMRCTGQGTVFLANLAQYIHVVDVTQDGLTVDAAYVLAMDSTLHHEVISVDSQFGISGTGAYNLAITGQGKVALMTSGEPLLLNVTPDTYVNADADAVVAWSTSLRVQMQAQTSSQGVWRRRGNTGEGWELSFLGQGYALVQPSEQLPPQNAQLGGLAGQYGVGQNQGNIFTNR